MSIQCRRSWSTRRHPCYVSLPATFYRGGNKGILITFLLCPDFVNECVFSFVFSYFAWVTGSIILSSCLCFILLSLFPCLIISTVISVGEAPCNQQLRLLRQSQPLVCHRHLVNISRSEPTSLIYVLKTDHDFFNAFYYRIIIIN